MEGTRLRILQLLQKNTHDTVEGLARAIGLAPATIRRHLDILQRDRLVAFEEVRKKTGRPAYSFYLTDGGQEALPKGYDELLGMMVHELSGMTAEDVSAKNGQQILDVLFRRLATNGTRAYEGELAGKGLAHRLETLMRHLGEADFYPEANVAAGTLRIRLHNCPFRCVALENDSVCNYDLHLISSMLDLDIQRAECIHDGDSGCMYSASLGDAGQRELLASAAG